MELATIELFFIDLEDKYLFQDVTIDTTKHTYRRFTTKNVKKCDKYLNELNNLMGEARLFQKVREVKKDIQTFLMELQQSGRYIGYETSEQRQKKVNLQQRIQSLDTKRYQLMKAAEKKCGKKKANGMFWYSTKLRIAAQELSKKKRLLRYLSTREGLEADIEEAKAQSDKAIKNLREVQQSDRQYRDEMMEELAKQQSTPWNMTPTSALKILQEAEKQSCTFKKSK